MAMEQSRSWQRLAVGSRQAGQGEVFLAVAMSQRVFAKPGEPQHVGNHVPTPQPACPCLGVALRRREKRGDGAGGAALPAASLPAPHPALPPRQAFVINTPGGKERAA